MPCRHYKSFFPKNSKKKGNKFKIEVIFFKKNFHTRFSTNKIQSNKLYFNLGNKIKNNKINRKRDLCPQKTPSSYIIYVEEFYRV